MYELMARPPLSDQNTDRPSTDFAVLYRAHSRDVLVFLTRRTLDPDLAMDITAETFAQALRARRRFRGTVDAERAWLFGIAKHVLSRSLRRGRSEDRALRRLAFEPPPLDADDTAQIVELAGLSDLRAAVAAELKALSTQQREAVHLRIVDELSYEQVAARLRISEPTARARVSRGLRTLAQALEAHLPQKESIP